MHVVFISNFCAGHHQKNNAMAEKRRLLAEIDKCFKKIDEGVELFEDTMGKMHEANSDNQRDKYQDDLKKEIKKLQRLRDQVKGWQNCSDIKDKEKLNHYRKVIEQRMEQFKDIERENKTKPHSKQGLCAEEKLDPREKEKSETIEWLQAQIRELSDESDRTEATIESFSTGDGGKRRGKNDSKKGEKEKKVEDLKHHLERMNFHISKLEICMRMVNNESLESKTVMEVLKDAMEVYIEELQSEDREDGVLESYDPEDAYTELNLGQLCAQLGTVNIGSMDDERGENGHDNGSTHESEDSKSSRHGSTDATPASPAPRRTVAAVIMPPPAASTPARLVKESSTESPALPSPVPATAVASTPPPPPPGIPYNSVAAGRATPAAATPPQPPSSIGKASFPIPSVARAPTAQQQSSSQSSAAPASSVPTPSAAPSAATTTTASAIGNDNPPSTANDTRTPVKPPVSSPAVVSNGPAAVADVKAASIDGLTSMDNGDVRTASESPAAPSRTVNANDGVAEEALRVLRLSQQNQQPQNTEPQQAHIPAWLGASPLGRAPSTQEHDIHQAALEAALLKTPLPMDSERPRTYLPKIPCPGSLYYPHNPPPNGDTLEYYLRLSPETLFFIFYYMEGTKAQLLAAKALKKLSWRFHTKYLTWFQRHEEPKQITDDFEQGTYVYFDFEKWSQRKKEAFTFEYRYLEDKDFD